MEKDIFNINKNELSYGRGYVYSLQYYLVWCTKYRKEKKDADSIQLWRRTTKTEYPDPPDPEGLPVCSQLPDRNP